MKLNDIIDKIIDNRGKTPPTNKLSGVPKKLGEEKRAREQKIADLETKNKSLEAKSTSLEAQIESTESTIRELINTKVNEVTTKVTAVETKIDTKIGETVARLNAVEEAVSHYPEYRAQSLAIQGQLKQADVNILEVCNAIKEDVTANRAMLDSRLKSLENREKNALRDKIYEHWRNFTDEKLNPRQAWTDMEQHAFNELVKDYESLGGNDYVHKVIIPAMTRLAVIPYMDNLDAVKELFDSRRTRNCD